jgi:acetoin utilization deacetylase AcuC-like enzyme
MTPVVDLLTDPRMATHRPPGHPERPERLEAAAAGVEQGALEAGATLHRTAVEPIEPAILASVHPARFSAALDETARRGGGWIDQDTYLGPESADAARLAAGASVQGAMTVAAGRAAVAFAVVRPPGHHASAERAAGFCIYNNVALAAAALRLSGLAQRIAILDWDVHHGDGTQAIFDADADLCYASTHQSPLYPGCGDAAERGRGAATGTKHNRPLHPGSGDIAFSEAWMQQLLPVVEEFRPEAVLISAGYDAHRADPLAELEVTEGGFETVARAIGEMVARLRLPGVALTLEGGYDLAALRDSVAATVVGLLSGLTGPERG